MKRKATSNESGYEMTTRSVDRGAFVEYYVTASLDAGSTFDESGGALFDAVANLMADEKVHPLQEKVFGASAFKPAILERRKRALEDREIDPNTPALFIDGEPAESTGLAGVQLWGVSNRDESSVSTVEGPAGVRGRLWEGPLRMLHLTSVDGRDDDGQLAATPAAQAERMFANAKLALEERGFAYTDVCRTWLYCAEILEWYGQLNRVRTAHHVQVGIGCDEERSVLPASTGIQGQSADEACIMDLVAMDASDSNGLRWYPVSESRRQGRAFSYGSAFSRGVEVDVNGRKTLHISGTASIDNDGRSTYRDDPEAQALSTLMSIASLLEARGATLENIVQATLFCKTREAFAAYEKAVGLLGIPSFPRVSVLADVCRPELLVEVDAVAIV